MTAHGALMGVGPFMTGLMITIISVVSLFIYDGYAKLVDRWIERDPTMRWQKRLGWSYDTPKMRRLNTTLSFAGLAIGLILVAYGLCVGL